MPINQEWFTDYQNQLIVHSSYWIYYDTLAAGPFTPGETLTFDSGGTPYTAICVYDNGTDRLNVVYLSDPSALTNNDTIEGGTSGASAAINVIWGQMNSTVIPYDTRAGGSFTTGAATVDTDNCYVIADSDLGGNEGELTVVYLEGAIANNDVITQGGVTAAVNATSFKVSKTTYTVRQLYSFVQDTFDELVQMDDTVPISAQTPTEFTMINGWFIDDDSTQYLSGGAIQSSSWDDEIDVLTLDSGTLAYVDPTPDDIGRTVVSDPGGTPVDIGPLLHYNSTTQKWWIRTSSITRIADNTEIGITSGTGEGTAAGASVTGETLYANIYTLGTIQTTPNPKTYVFQNSEALSEWWGRGDSEAHIDVLIKIKEADTEIDGANITVFVRHFADLYDHFPIDISSGGRNAVPLATQADLNNSTSGEITIAYEAQSGSWTVGNFVRDTTTGASGEILDDDDQGATGTLTIGNVVAGTAGSFDFTATNTIQETIDGTSSGDVASTSATISAAGVSAVVRNYNDIGIYFVNITLPITDNTGGAEPATGTLFTGDTSTAEAYYVGSDISGGSWATNDAVGTIYLANWTDTTSFQAETVSFAGGTVTTSAGETIAKQVDKAFEQGSANPYNVIVDCAGRTMAHVYEWFKYVTRENANSSQPAAFNHITMYRVNDATTAVIEEDGEEYIYAQTVYTPVKASPFGTFAGGKLFGARGVWVENMDNADRQNFQLIDATGDTQTPPNFITITVNSVVSGDKVSVFRTSSGTVIDKSQFNSHDTNNSITDTTFEVEETIPSDTPSSGYIRVVDADDTSINRESRYAYSSWTGSIFTLSGAAQLDRTYDDGDTAYVPYFDEIAADTTVSVTVIFNAAQTVLTRVRQYDNTTPSNSILPFQITGSVSSSGYTVAAIRTADTIVTSYP
jgi:hypothetical protein